MKTQPYKYVDRKFTPCEPAHATHVKLCLPGPLPYRMLPVMQKGTREGTPNWTWNGDTEKPTLKPSILTWTNEHRCHSFVADGKVKFLADCSHEFAGQTLDLLDVAAGGEVKA